MEKPNYVLKVTGSEVRPIDHNLLRIWARRIMWIAVLAFLVYGIFWSGIPFWTYLEHNYTTILVLAIVLFLVRERTDFFPLPVEIRFYEDYLVLYEEKRYYSRKVSKMNQIKMMYKDISSCRWDIKNNDIFFDGIMNHLKFVYNADGTLQEMPSYDKTADSSWVIFTRFCKDVNFAEEIEAHSPVKVEMIGIY